MHNTKGSIVQANNEQIDMTTDLIVKGRNILNELDNLHRHMLLLPRDQKLETK